MTVVGRNDPCPCGSGKKFKRCHGAGVPEQPERSAPMPAHTVAPLLEQALAWHRSGRLQDAERVYRAILQSFPDHPLALLYLGVLGMQAGRAAEALPVLQAAVSRNPSHAEAHFNLGGCYLALQRFDAAAACFERTLALQPDTPQALNNLGNIWRYFGRMHDALACYRRAAAANPRDDASSHSNLLVCLHFDPTLSSEELFAEHLRWAERHAKPFYPAAPAFRNSRDPDRVLRIGFVSPSFTSTIVGHFLIGLFRGIDRSRHSLHCYSATREPDAMTEALRGLAQGWRDIAALDDEAACRQIESDGIDILVDLAGHNPGNRLGIFARKPAPVQIAWLDYFDTTGLATMDYIVTDPLTTPQGSAQRFTETLLYMPESRLCFTPIEDAPPPSPRPSGAPPVFGSFNRLDKINDEVIQAWSRILLRVPEARLVIKNSALAVPDVAARFRQRFLQCAVGEERIELRPSSSHRELLAQYADIDLALDPFPYNGGATTLDALWMGVPVLALAGERMIGRQSTAMLSCIGRDDLVANDLDQYVELSVRKAFEVDRLREERLQLRERMRVSALCDTSRFARAMEDNLRSAWRRWCAGQAIAKEQVHAFD
jgi:predicted O-linked N-acetylglucosamine transferase (SPINDLY family)